MRKISILFFSLLLTACSNDDDENSPILGTWNELYSITTSYDIETGEQLNINVSAWGAIIDFRSSNNLTYHYLGVNFSGRYIYSGKELRLILESDTTSYNVDELSSERMVLSKDNEIQGKKFRESILRVFSRPDYQLTEDDIKYIYSPITTN